MFFKCWICRARQMFIYKPNINAAFLSTDYSLWYIIYQRLTLKFIIFNSTIYFYTRIYYFAQIISHTLRFIICWPHLTYLHWNSWFCWPWLAYYSRIYYFVNFISHISTPEFIILLASPDILTMEFMGFLTLSPHSYTKICYFVDFISHTSTLNFIIVLALPDIPAFCWLNLECTNIEINCLGQWNSLLERSWVPSQVKNNKNMYIFFSKQSDTVKRKRKFTCKQAISFKNSKSRFSYEPLYRIAKVM